MIDDFYCIFVILILDNQILDYTFIGLSHHHKINNKYVLFFNNRETELKKRLKLLKYGKLKPFYYINVSSNYCTFFSRYYMYLFTLGDYQEQ